MKSSGLRLGAHVSVAGGVFNAPAQAKALGCDVMQIFTKNQRQWKSPTLTDDECAQLKAQAKSCNVDLAHSCSHASYLINIAASKLSTRRSSVALLQDEVERCERLGVGMLAFHPGAHVGQGEDAGLDLVIRALNDVLRRTRGGRTRILLETTAGQGSCLGHRLEHLHRILDGVREPERMGVCVDTCHIFAAGYDLRTAEAYRETARQIKKIIGKKTVRAFHLNDSKTPFGSRVDRHEHIGEGSIGVEGFRLLMNDPDWAGVPGFLETPGGPEGYARNLAVLRSFCMTHGA